MIQKFLDSLDLTATQIPVKKSQKELFERWLKNTFYMGALPGSFGAANLDQVTRKINEAGYITLEVVASDFILITWQDQSKTMLGYRNQSYLLLNA